MSDSPFRTRAGAGLRRRAAATSERSTFVVMELDGLHVAISAALVVRVLRDDSRAHDIDALFAGTIAALDHNYAASHQRSVMWNGRSLDVHALPMVLAQAASPHERRDIPGQVWREPYAATRMRGVHDGSSHILIIHLDMTDVAIRVDSVTEVATIDVASIVSMSAAPQPETVPAWFGAVCGAFDRRGRTVYIVDPTRHPGPSRMHHGAEPSTSVLE